jgi:hypothetical protein
VDFRHDDMSREISSDLVLGLITDQEEMLHKKENCAECVASSKAQVLTSEGRT